MDHSRSFLGKINGSQVNCFQNRRTIFGTYSKNGPLFFCLWVQKVSFKDTSLRNLFTTLKYITRYVDGTIYFVKGTNIGSEFGFPRNNIKKRYRWKKMNFTTDLPKKDP